MDLQVNLVGLWSFALHDNLHPTHTKRTHTHTTTRGLITKHAYVFEMCAPAGATEGKPADAVCVYNVRHL